MVVSQNKGTPIYVDPKNTITLIANIIRCPKIVPVILGSSPPSCLCNSLSLPDSDGETTQPGPYFHAGEHSSWIFDGFSIYVVKY